jgi:hypothetical protein
MLYAKYISMCEQLDAVDEVRWLFRQIFANGESEGENISEPILVSFDVSHGMKNSLNTIGVSILDTRSFARLETRKLKPHQHTHSILWTGTYVLYYGNPGVRRAREKARFGGHVQKVTKSNRMSLLSHLFSYDKEEDTESCCQSHKFRPFQPPIIDVQSSSRSAANARPIIVVGHDIRNDLRSLSNVGFDITQVARVVSFLDTQKIARDFFWKEDRGYNVSLKDLCAPFGIEAKKLHNCGNDAACTLLVLLSLAYKILENDTPGNDLDESDEHGKDTPGSYKYPILEETVQAALMSGEQRRRQRREEQEKKSEQEKSELAKKIGQAKKIERVKKMEQVDKMAQEKEMKQEQQNVKDRAENFNSATSYSTTQWGCEVK